LDKAMTKIAAEGGVVVVLGREESAEELLAHLQTFEKEDKGEQPAAARRQGTSRRVGIGSQILADLGVHKMRLLSSPKKYHALAGFGLEVVEYLSE
jgi:3,4-dihydroxy 2-butanone 4-phosphate synthase/GTP cyclohydrolase II